MKRLEFSKPVKIEMFRRAGGPNNLRCEKCQLRLMGKPFEYDHQIEEWERQNIAADLRPPLTADDGKLLCIPCHDEKSGKKAGERAHGKRIVGKAARAKPKSSFATNRNGAWKKKMDGTLERRS
jgi:hypothetical protein